MTTFYTDLSHHDWNRCKGEMDFAQIKRETSGAVCIRATYGDPEGVHYDTQHFGDMTKAAKAAGFTLLGAYHNLVKGDQASINRQVDWLRREMDKYGSNWAMCDVERFEELMSNGYYPRWDDVEQFHDRWHAVDDRVLAWYIPDWVWDASLGRHTLTGLKGPLVASEYGSNPSNGSASDLYRIQGGDGSDKWHSYGGRTPEILQYGSNFVCDGASSKTDADAFRGTFAQLTKLLTGDGDMSAEDLLDEDVVPNRPWRSDVATNPNVRWEFAVTNTWDEAHYAKVASEEAKKLAEEAKKLAEANAKKLDDILALLQANGGQPPTVVDLTDAAVEKVADAVTDEQGERLSGGPAGS